MPPELELLGRLANGDELVRMLCAIEPTPEGQTPEWLHIMPFGPIVVPRDGRGPFQVTDAHAVSARSALPMLIDWEHRSEWGETRAAGWIETLEVAIEGGKFPQPGVWGKASWTPQGRDDVIARAFRFLSPVLLINPETREVKEIASVALTNRPALAMHGIESFRERLSARFGPLAREGGGHRTMDAATRRALCSAFGTQPEADDAIIIQRAQAVAAELAQQREACARLTTDLTNANQQLTEARTRIEEQERAAFTSEVEQLLSRASETGQLTPAMVPNWREFCSQSRANFEMFRDKLLPTMPKLAPASRAPASQTPPTSNTPTTSPTSNSRRERNSVSGRLHGLGMTDEEIARADAYNAEVMARVEED